MIKNRNNPTLSLAFGGKEAPVAFVIINDTFNKKQEVEYKELLMPIFEKMYEDLDKELYADNIPLDSLLKRCSHYIDRKVGERSIICPRLSNYHTFTSYVSNNVSNNKKR